MLALRRVITVSLAALSIMSTQHTVAVLLFLALTAGCTTTSSRPTRSEFEDIPVANGLTYLPNKSTIIESPTDSYPSVSGNAFTFTGVKFDGKTLKATNPSALNADDRGSNTWIPGAISSNGTGFSITRH